MNNIHQAIATGIADQLKPHGHTQIHQQTNQHWQITYTHNTPAGRTPTGKRRRRRKRRRHYTITLLPNHIEIHNQNGHTTKIPYEDPKLLDLIHKTTKTCPPPGKSSETESNEPPTETTPK